MTKFFKQRLPQPADRGASMVEYAFLVILVAIIAFTAVQVIGGEVSTSFSQTADGFSAGTN